MNYTNLQARISKRFQDRSDLTTVIQNAINDIRREICSGEMSLVTGAKYQRRWSFCFQSTTQAITVGDNKYDFPTGTIEVLSLAIGTAELTKLPSFETWMDRYGGSTNTGQPIDWIPRDGEYWLGPTPDTSYTLSVYYFGLLADLSGGTDETKLEILYPMLVLDGASALVAEYLNQDNFYQTYSNRFEKKLLQAIASDAGSQLKHTRQRMRSYLEDSVNSDRYRV